MLTGGCGCTYCDGLTPYCTGIEYMLGLVGHPDCVPDGGAPLCIHIKFRANLKIAFLQYAVHMYMHYHTEKFNDLA